MAKARIAVIGAGLMGREIALVWRKGTGRREEFQLLAKEIRKLAKAS